MTGTWSFTLTDAQGNALAELSTASGRTVAHGYCQCGCGEKTTVPTSNRPQYGWIKGQPTSYRRGHKRGPLKTVRWIEEDRGYETPCWVWQLATRGGYARAARGVTVHVEMWERQNGPVPEGLDLDHLCRVRACVNPAHLEPVTRSENLRRMTRKLSLGERKLAAMMDTKTAVKTYGISPSYAWRLRQTHAS